MRKNKDFLKEYPPMVQSCLLRLALTCSDTGHRRAVASRHAFLSKISPPFIFSIQLKPRARSPSLHPILLPGLLCAMPLSESSLSNLLSKGKRTSCSYGGRPRPGPPWTWRVPGPGPRGRTPDSSRPAPSPVTSHPHHHQAIRSGHPLSVRDYPQLNNSKFFLMVFEHCFLWHVPMDCDARILFFMVT